MKSGRSVFVTLLCGALAVLGTGCLPMAFTLRVVVLDNSAPLANASATFSFEDGKRKRFPATLDSQGAALVKGTMDYGADNGPNLYVTVGNRTVRCDYFLDRILRHEKNREALVRGVCDTEQPDGPPRAELARFVPPR